MVPALAVLINFRTAAFPPLILGVEVAVPADPTLIVVLALAAAIQVELAVIPVLIKITSLFSPVAVKHRSMSTAVGRVVLELATKGALIRVSLSQA
jgi:hypothetical protein